MLRASLALALFLAATPMIGCAADLDEDIGEDSSAATKKKKDKEKEREKGAEAPAPSKPAATKFKVITHNIYGAGNDGAPAALNLVTEQAQSWGPDVVMLQEVCEQQRDAFKERFPDWDVHYSPMIPQEERCENRAIGIMLASRRNLTDVVVTDLGEAFGRFFTMLCADVRFQERAHGVRACVTHLRAWADAEAEPMRIAQTKAIHDALAPRIRNQGQAVVVAGDFNAGAHRAPMDNMYRQRVNGEFNGPGLFREADQTDETFFGKDRMAPEVRCAKNSCRSGEDTHGPAKLDYIFFSMNRANGAVNGEVMGTGKSDHNLYRGWAEIDN